MTDKEVEDAAARLKQKGICCEIKTVNVRVGKTRPDKSGQYSSNRADVEFEASTIIDITHPNSKISVDDIITALNSLASKEVDKILNDINKTSR
jgi:hypothetical protein